MRNAHFLMFAVTLALGACAAVSTRVVELNPAQRYAPTQSVEVLLQKPTRPHVDLALIEAEGGSEAALFNEAREKARALGADAIVKTEIERRYHEPVAVYDPWYDPFFFGFYHYRAFPAFAHPWGPYRFVGGGYSYLLKAVAIKYADNVKGPPSGSPK